MDSKNSKKTGNELNCKMSHAEKEIKRRAEEFYATLGIGNAGKKRLSNIMFYDEVDVSYSTNTGV